jgi:hypothetical protein
MDVGSYVMIALLGAGAAYGLASRGKPKPALSNTRKRVAIACFALAIGCFSLALLVGLTSHNPVPH